MLRRHQSRGSESITMSFRRPARVCLHHYYGGARSKDKQMHVKGWWESAHPQRIHRPGVRAALSSTKTYHRILTT